jgi:NADPH-dependent 2,4-dienoyl-CoA reductase/sulfur reductase-like enzyme
MKISINSQRRRLASVAGAGALAAASGGLLSACSSTAGASAASRPKLGRVLVIGGGYGGATAAKYIKKWGGDAIDVMLVERETAFVSCPLSNLVLGGHRKIEDLTVSYAGLRQAGVLVMNDEVLGIDPGKMMVSFRKLADQRFDRIVVSPGVDFDFGSIQGLNDAAQKRILHAWKAGPQTVALRAQLEAMPDGGTYVLSIPKAPYRCPPGPYERVCQVASYFKAAKPRSKIIVLDANPDIQSKKGLFLAAWNGQYKGMIEYRANNMVTEVDAGKLAAVTELGDRVGADVLNVVPAMAAAQLAHKAGLVNVNNLWCGVDWVTLESTAAKGIHVLGDSTFSAPAMPKSGHMANQHGKAAAAAIVELMNGRAPQPVTMANTCYSFIDADNVVHVAAVHRYDADKKTMVTVPGSGGLSSEANRLEGVYANSWAQNIWNDMLT